MVAYPVGLKVTLTRETHVKGMWLMLLACACFSMTDVAMGNLGLGLPLVAALVVRYGFQTASAALLVACVQGGELWRSRQYGYQLMRGILLLFVTGLGFSALRHLPVAEFTAIAMTTPILSWRSALWS